jgi:hypothetical protein
MGVTVQAVTAWRRRRSRAHGASDTCGRPAAIPPAARTQIRDCYLAHYGEWGPQVLQAWCERQQLGSWSATTIAAVIDDLKEPDEVEPPPARLTVTAPDVMWSEDGTGFKRRRRKRELLVVQDDYSRRKLNHRLVPGPASSRDVVSYLKEAFARHGAPLVLKHDGDSIFHDAAVSSLLDRHGVVSLTSPAGWPGYNGKQERSMRDIKSFERALRRHGVGGSLATRLELAMTDLNDERPRPVLGGRTAREAHADRTVTLPDRRDFTAAVDDEETRLMAEAMSRRDANSARRRAIENVLMRDGLLVIEGDVSRD